jgi:uncharacterized protein
MGKRKTTAAPQARSENRRLSGGGTRDTGQFHIIAKPAGPSCNLQCDYCFYWEKSALFPRGERNRMPDDVLEAFVRKYIASRAGDEVEFVWQGGEPALAGLAFYEKALELQARYSRGKRVRNSLQTNGTLLDDRWCEFLAKNSFLVGLSLDGPEDVHDRYRHGADGQSSFKSVMNALALLKKHGIAFNVLASVTDYAAARPLQVYRFLKAAGVEFVQFIPIAEREANTGARQLGLRLAMPPSPATAGEPAEVTPWSVGGEAYGDFLLSIFAEWIRSDVGRMFVMNFEWTLGTWAGLPPGVCVFAPTCGRYLAMERTGEVYACDHYVYPAWHLGNIRSHEIADMLSSRGQVAFGDAKQGALSRQCRQCPMLPACNGGCPKHRFARTAEGEEGLNYFCKGYLNYFAGVGPYMKVMAGYLAAGEPVTKIMDTHVIVTAKQKPRP